MPNLVSAITTGAPLHRTLNTKDESAQALPVEPKARPQHFPLYFLQLQKGLPNDNPVSVDGGQRISYFGAASFDPLEKFFNHQTVFCNGTLAAGNQCMIKRIKAPDAGPSATITLWLDVLSTTFKKVARGIDGKITYDQSGNPTEVGQAVPGYKLRWVATNYTSEAAMAQFGIEATKQGTMTDTTTNATSTMYPILQLKATTYGSYYNLCGIRAWAPTRESSEGFNADLFTATKSYPFRLASVRRETATTAPVVVDTVDGTSSLELSLVPGARDPIYKNSVYVGTEFLKGWTRTGIQGIPDVYGDFGTLKVYDANIAAIQALIAVTESTHLESWADASTALELTSNSGLINLFGGVWSTGAPYHTVKFDGTSLPMTNTTNIMAGGASDGTFTDASYAAAVEAEMAKFLDVNSPLNDMIEYPFSHIYDSGFPSATKYKLFNAMAYRPNTRVVVSTFVKGATTPTLAQENSIGALLLNAARAFPESEYFGTETMRAIIYAGAARLMGNAYQELVPVSYLWMQKHADLAGAADGAYKQGAGWEGESFSAIFGSTDFTNPYRSPSQKVLSWNSGLNYVQKQEGDTYHFPAYRSVYSKATSTLSSWSTVEIISELHYILEVVQRALSGGGTDLSDEQFAERVNKNFMARIANKFASKVQIEIDTMYTAADKQRGFSWTVPVVVRSNVGKTVQSSYVIARRRTE